MIVKYIGVILNVKGIGTLGIEIRNSTLALSFSFFLAPYTLISDFIFLSPSVVRPTRYDGEELQSGPRLDCN